MRFTPRPRLAVILGWIGLAAAFGCEPAGTAETGSEGAEPVALTVEAPATYYGDHLRLLNTEAFEPTLRGLESALFRERLEEGDYERVRRGIDLILEQIAADSGDDYTARRLGGRVLQFSAVSLSTDAASYGVERELVRERWRETRDEVFLSAPWFR